MERAHGDYNDFSSTDFIQMKLLCTEHGTQRIFALIDQPNQQTAFIHSKMDVVLLHGIYI